VNLELVEHLEKARDTVNQVNRIVSSHEYPGDARTVMVIGELSTIMAYHRSMLELIKSGAISSSRALARDIVQGMRYGLWMNACATQEQILRIQETDELPLTVLEAIEKINAAYNTDTFFESLKSHWGSQLHKYSISGLFRLGRWRVDPKSGLAHEDEEIRDVTTIGTLCIVLLAAKFLAHQNYGAECKEVEALAVDYV
jgi:hypothetical protein